MNAKQWVSFFMVMILLIIGIHVSINYFINPSNIFETKLFSKYGQLNERFLKIKYLDKNYKKYNSYMFGSSRIGTTEPTVIEKYIPNSKFYNFTLSLGNMYDYSIHLQYFIKKYEIQNLYLQIDIDEMLYYKVGGFHRQIHPNVLDEDLFSFYKINLFGFYPVGLRKKIKDNFFAKEVKDYNLSKGVWYRPTRENNIKNNYKLYIEKESTFHKKNSRKKGLGANYSKTINSLKNIVKLCKHNNINLIIFTTPHNKNMMDTYKTKAYLQFIVDIAKITNFYDFSGYNTITLNNLNYYESSHYRPSVGTLIAARIFNDKLVKVPNDFGIYVTKENVFKHIINLKEQIKFYDKQ